MQVAMPPPPTNEYPVTGNILMLNVNQYLGYTLRAPLKYFKYPIYIRGASGALSLLYRLFQFCQEKNKKKLDKFSIVAIIGVYIIFKAR